MAVLHWGWSLATKRLHQGVKKMLIYGMVNELIWRFHFSGYCLRQVMYFCAVLYLSVQMARVKCNTLIALPGVYCLLLCFFVQVVNVFTSNVDSALQRSHRPGHHKCSQHLCWDRSCSWIPLCWRKKIRSSEGQFKTLVSLIIFSLCLYFSMHCTIGPLRDPIP